LGEKGHPREWLHIWYSPRQNNDTKVTEYAFNHSHKLYRTGDFYDLQKDPDERSPLAVAGLSGPAAASIRVLRGALDNFNDARPKELDKMVSKPAAE